MSDLVDRIAEVLLSWPYPPMSAGNARVLAERVAAELQLTEELRPGTYPRQWRVVSPYRQEVQP